MSSGNVKLASEAGSFDAYLAVPTQPNGDIVVLLQEIFGVNSNIRAIATRLADQGFHVIAPDLFWRQQPNVELDPSVEGDREKAGALLRGLDQSLAVSDALIAAEHIRGLKESGGRVGAVGYCLGGKLAYLLSMEKGIDVAVSYYGVSIQSAVDRIEQVRCPLLLHLAADDHLCPPEAQQAIADAAATRGPLITIMTYPGAGHAFARLGSPSYQEQSARRADAATLQFLDRYTTEAM